MKLGRQRPLGIPGFQASKLEVYELQSQIQGIYVHILDQEAAAGATRKTRGLEAVFSLIYRY